MANNCIYTCLTITFLIIQVTSEIIYIDLDTGKRVDPPQAPPQSQYNNGYFNKQYTWQQPNIGVQSSPYRQQTSNPIQNNIDGQWVCKHSKTGDMMIISSEISNRSPVQMPQQPYYPQPPIYTNNQYQTNPWIDQSGQQSQKNNQWGVQPPQNYPQNPGYNGGNNPSVVEPSTNINPITEASTTLTTSSSNKLIPTLANIDWIKYITTTDNSNSSDLHKAISGEGIIMPRTGNN